MLRDSQRFVRHWRRLTKMMRVGGIALIVVGTMTAVESMRTILDSGRPFLVNGVPGDSLTPRVIGLVLASLAAIAGVGVVSMRAHRPDLGDRSVLDKLIEPFDDRQTPPYRGARTWWTGDPKSD